MLFLTYHSSFKGLFLITQSVKKTLIDQDKKEAKVDWGRTTSSKAKIGGKSPASIEQKIAEIAGAYFQSMS